MFRDDLNAVLETIGSESLTDEEFDALSVTDDSLPVEIYTAIAGVLDSRESVSDQKDRLKYYYLARGVQVSTITSARTNILIGFPIAD